MNQQDILIKISSQSTELLSSSSKMDFIEELGKSKINSISTIVEEWLNWVLVNDTNPVIRHEAAFVLGRLYAKGEIKGNIAIPSLCNSACFDNSIIVRHEAAESLGYCLNNSYVLKILRKLESDLHPDISETAKIGVERLTSTPK